MKFQCPHNDCDKVFAKRFGLRDHLIYVHNDIISINICPICSEMFSSKKELSNHEKNIHGDFMCSECSQTFSEKSYLATHMKTHSDERPKYQCDYCDRTYLYKANLTNHIRIKHSGFKFICGFCHRELSSKKKLEDHLLNKHSPLAEVEIQLCEEYFDENYEDEDDKSIKASNLINATIEHVPLAIDSSSVDSIEFSPEDFDLLDLEFSE